MKHPLPRKFDGCHDDLKWAVAQSSACTSERSCLKHATCLDNPLCKALGPLGMTAGFIVPTESAQACGYCVPAYRGFVCFCPTRWALYRGSAPAD